MRIFTLVFALACPIGCAAPEPVLEVASAVGWYPDPGDSPPMPRAVVRRDVREVDVEVVARGLEVPWSIVFAPDGRMLFSERPGRIRALHPDGRLETWADLSGVVAEGEGGVLGLALDARDEDALRVVVMYTTERDGERVNRVSSLRDSGTGGDDERVLVDDIPGADRHDGGALAIGPDGMLYVGTGDAKKPRLAQRLDSLAGKILRVTLDGEIPADNPFEGSPVWAYGFRNVSALAFEPESGALWAASHGPSGEYPGLEARDAVYVVERGRNHGWPLEVGVSDEPDIVSPVLYYEDEAHPPGGATFYDGALFPRMRGDFLMTTLRSETLERVRLRDGAPLAIERWYRARFGRLRAIAVGPDGAIYLSTSNRDGRAEQTHPGSDFIYRLIPTR